jgi:hypothetical protein
MIIKICGVRDVKCSRDLLNDRLNEIMAQRKTAWASLHEVLSHPLCWTIHVLELNGTGIGMVLKLQDQIACQASFVVLHLQLVSAP